MPYVLVEDFKSGIDTRRTVVTSVPGSCVTLTNAHITRGGEIEKRRAFKEWCTLPNNTFGLAAAGGRIFVFGSDNITLSSSLPANLNYVRFQHADLSTSMTDILGLDFFDGRVYASAQFEDAKIYHYWDGYSKTGTQPTNRIDDWYEARARTNFNVTGGNATTSTGTAATSSFYISEGSNLPGDTIKLRIKSKDRTQTVDIMGTTISHTGDNNTTAAAIAAAINSYTSVPNFTATSSTNNVYITAATKGTLYNGWGSVEELGGNFEINGNCAIGTLSGGVDNAITDIQINGKSIIQDPILWEESHSYTATKIRDEINKTRTDPEWEATSVDSSARVNITAYERADGATTLHHNLGVSVTKTGDLTINPSTPANTYADPGVASTSYSPGGFVRAFDDKMHSLSDSRWHQSCVGDPSDWKDEAGNFSDATNLSNHARGSEELMAIAPYFQNLAVFGKDAVQVWFNDPDPSKSSRVQVLNGTGTVAGRSVCEIGDSDVFYLSRSGIRSLKSRDSSNAAYVGDIGNPIDDLIVADINVNVDTTSKACGIVDPRDGRYLLAIGTKVYVFSYFPSSNVSAWSVYETGFDDAITDWAYDGTQLLCRAGNKIYSLGGEANDQYDSSQVTIQLPFLDAQNPASDKMWTGLDAVCTGDWTISVGTDPTDISTYETAATINKPTYGMGRVGLSSTSSHLALRIVNNSSGAATLGNIAVHYELIGSG